MLLIRCERCHTVVWVCRDPSASIQCSHCAQRYELPPRLRGRSVDELHRQARGLAKELNVDFPSATSMAFGILKLPQVQDFLSGGGEQEAVGREEQTGGWSTEFDEAFEPAVDSGRLTLHAALQRGSRESYASRLVARHGIAITDAYRVADNEESLLAVLRRRQAAPPRRLVTPRRARIGITVALGVAALVWLALWQAEHQIIAEVDLSLADEAQRAEIERDARLKQARLPEPPAPTPPPLPELFFDQLGRVTRISAPRPEAVLQAYCRTPGLQPVALAEGMMPDKNLWLGVFFDDADPNRTQAIVIRKEQKGGQWVAGDGQSEIHVLNPQPERLGKRRELESGSFAISAAENR